MPGMSFTSRSVLTRLASTSKWSPSCGCFRAATTATTATTTGITGAHPAEKRDVDHRVPAFSDTSFLRAQLQSAKVGPCMDIAKVTRLEKVLQLYDAMGYSGNNQSSGEWQENDGVLCRPHHDNIGDMQQFLTKEEDQEWTQEIAEAMLNLDLYPLDKLDSMRGQELVEHIREQLLKDKTCFLPDFMRPEAVAASSDLFEFLDKKGYTHFSNSHHNVYFSASDTDNYPVDHPVNIHGYRSHGFLAGDFLDDEQTVLKHVFRWQPFRTLIERALNLENKIYCSRDPVNQIVCNVQGDGEEFPWHFDGNEYIITLTLREASQGGELWTAPDMRSPGDENTESLKKLLFDTKELVQRAGGAHVDATQLEYQKVASSATSRVRAYKANPGDLQFFMGRYCLHQISKVYGSPTRQVAIFAYSNEENYVNPVSRSILNCGRAYPMHYERERSMQRDHF